MNARQHELRLTVEIRQVADAVECLMHSLLVHRTLAKFKYDGEKSFSLGSIGVKEVDCEQIDLSYVRVNSPELTRSVQKDVQMFKNEVMEASYSGSAPRRTPSVGSPTESAVPLLRAQIALDFYQRQRRQSVGVSWFGGGSDDCQVWEEWKLILDIFRVEHFDELAKMREAVSNEMADLILMMCEKINQPIYVPKMPTKTELNDVFDTSFSDCQPYLFKIRRQAVPNSLMKPSFTQHTLQRCRDVLF